MLWYNNYTIKTHPLQLWYQCKSSWLSWLYRSPLRREDTGLPLSSWPLHLCSLPTTSTRVRNPLWEVKIDCISSAKPCIKAYTHSELTGLLLGSQAGAHPPHMDWYTTGSKNWQGNPHLEQTTVELKNWRANGRSHMCLSVKFHTKGVDRNYIRYTSQSHICHIPIAVPTVRLYVVMYSRDMPVPVPVRRPYPYPYPCYARTRTDRTVTLLWQVPHKCELVSLCMVLFEWHGVPWNHLQIWWL